MPLKAAGGRKRDGTVFKSMGEQQERLDTAEAPAALVVGQVVPAAVPTGAAVPARRAAFSERVAAWRAMIEHGCARLDLAPDLTADIGSRRWFRGLGTMLGLTAAALAMWPDFSQVEAAVALPADPAVRDEFRSQMIMPLGLGADSGRHMGATPLVRGLSDAPERPRLQLATTLGQGDSLSRMLARAGLGAVDIANVASLVGHAVAGGTIEPGTRFDIVLGPRSQPGAPRPLESLGFRARFDLDLAIARRGGALSLARNPIAVDQTPLRITGQVGSSLYRSARNAGAPMAAIQAYLRALDSHLSLESDLDADDRFDMIVSYKRSATGERQVGDLLFAGLERGGRPRLQLLRWGPQGSMLEAPGSGDSVARPIGAPVAGHITSGFGMRFHPILGYTRMHAGIDFGARYGSPIYAVADGLVVFAGRHGGHGNYVRLDHGGGHGTGYAHMSRIAVAPGTRVHAGEVIGYVGSTGLSTGPHLHFEAYRGGRVVDPAGLRFASMPRIDPRDAAAFRQRLAVLTAVPSGAALAPFGREHN